MRRLFILAVSTALFSSNIFSKAFDIIETGSFAEMASTTTFELVNGTYVERSEQKDYENAKLIAYRKINGKEVLVQDKSEELRRPSVESADTSQFIDEIKKIGRSQIQFSSSNISLTGATEFKQDLSLREISTKSRGRISHLTIPADDYQAMYSPTLNLVHGLLFGLEALANLETTNEEINFSPISTSDFVCESRNHQRYLDCTVTLRFEMRIIEKKEKINPSEHLVLMIEKANGYIEVGAEDYNNGYTAYTPEAWQEIKNDFYRLKEDLEKLDGALDIDVFIKNEIEMAIQVIILSNGQPLTIYNSPIPLMLNNQAAIIAEKLSEIYDSL